MCSDSVAYSGSDFEQEASIYVYVMLTILIVLRSH